MAQNWQGEYMSTHLSWSTGGWSPSNPWGVSFQRMFDMTNDSRVFKTAAELARGIPTGGRHVYTKGVHEFRPAIPG